MISAAQLESWETCNRRAVWTEKYENLRVTLTRALYVALHAGLLTENDPERAATDKFLELAASPGLDVTGEGIYSIAMHHAKLAGIVAAALRSTVTAPWRLFPATDTWESACYDMGDGKPRRIVLVDRWSESRKQEEIYGWRTMGEVCSLDRETFITAVTIGPVKDKRRHSAWTKCYRHPISFIPRFKLRDKKQFSADWMPQWREDSGVPTADWLTTMHEDGCMNDLVHTMNVPVPTRKDAYLAEMERLAGEMVAKRETPPMRLAGCFGFNPCPFVSVCHGSFPNHPFRQGFKARKAKGKV